MTTEEKKFSAAIRIAANKGKVVVIEARTRDLETGGFIGNQSMNESIRSKAGRASGQEPLAEDSSDA